MKKLASVFTMLAFLGVAAPALVEAAPKKKVTKKVSKKRTKRSKKKAKK